MAFGHFFALGQIVARAKLNIGLFGNNTHGWLMAISCAVDCVHADARRKGIAEILARYQPKEHSQLFTGFRDLTDP